MRAFPGAAPGRRCPAWAFPRGGHRRVLLSDALAYKQASAKRTRLALEELREQATAGGLYDMDVEDYLSQFDR